MPNTIPSRSSSVLLWAATGALLGCLIGTAIVLADPSQKSLPALFFAGGAVAGAAAGFFIRPQGTVPAESGLGELPGGGQVEIRT
jgi:hypothetical protein